jgi:hypothetical protein
VKRLALLNPVTGELGIVHEPALDDSVDRRVYGRGAVSVLHQPLPHLSCTTRPWGQKKERVLVGAFGVISVEQIEDSVLVELIPYAKGHAEVGRERKRVLTVQEDVDALGARSGLQGDS